MILPELGGTGAGFPPPRGGMSLPTYLRYAPIQSVAIAFCAIFRSIAPSQTSLWSLFSSTSFLWALYGDVTYDCGQRFLSELEPPSSRLIRWSTSYSLGMCEVMPYSA